MRDWMVFERALIWVLWMGWAAYWIFAARDTAANQRTESWRTGASYRIPLACGILLLVSSKPSGTLRGFLLWPPSVLGLTLGLSLIAAGLSIAVWARRYLGKYWSGRITLKIDHRIIQTGPYAWVRHPIYSGLLLALFGTVISVGTVQSCVGFAFIVFSIVRKLMLEEKWMCAHFGAEYELYRRRVRALIPHNL
jgi:protein-S-isoprenylcysteine O-methyltransferase Ste14